MSTNTNCKYKNIFLNDIFLKFDVILIRYTCVHEHVSLFLLGTGIEDGSWSDLVEWLILQGAQKFIIALEDPSLMPIKNSKYRFLSRKDLQVLFVPASVLEEKRETNALIKKTENEFGSLEAIFFVSIVKKKKTYLINTTHRKLKMTNRIV